MTNRSGIKSIVKKAFTVLFLLAVATVLINHLPELISNARELSLPTISLLILLQLLTLLLIVCQWYLCAGIFEKNDKRSRMRLRDFWILNSYGKLLEGVTPAVKTGGEGLKAVMLSQKYDFRKDDAVFLVIAQKAVSMISFMLVMAATYLIVFRRVSDISELFLNISLSGPLLTWKVVLGSSLLVVLIILGYAFLRQTASTRILAKISQIFDRFEGVAQLLNRLSQLKVSFLENKASVLGAFLLGLLIWTLLGFKAYLISLDLGHELSPFQVGNATFTGYLFAMLPISPGGIGTYEGPMTYWLYSMGLGQASALTLSILSRIFTFWLDMLISFVSVIINTIIKRVHKRRAA